MQRVDDVRAVAPANIWVLICRKRNGAFIAPCSEKWKNRFNAQTINAIKPTIFMIFITRQIPPDGVLRFSLQKTIFLSRQLPSSFRQLLCREYRPASWRFLDDNARVISAQWD